MSAPIRLLVNPAAGGGKAGRVLPDVLAALEVAGLQVRSEMTRDLAHARALARDAALCGETVVCLSGDGMLGAVADELRVLPDALLGVLPGGRGNDLARVLGISADPVEACAVLAAGFSRRLDLGEVLPHGGPVGARSEGLAGEAPATSAGHAFVGIASVGFDSEANRIANEAPAWLGGLVYAYGALRALLSWRPARFEIELTGFGAGADELTGSSRHSGELTGPDGPAEPISGARANASATYPVERYSFYGYTVGACNSKTYGGGMRAAPDALLDDGALDVIVLGSVGKLKFLTRILPKVFSGAHVREPNVKAFRAREVVIRADRPFTVYADGDPIGELPVTVRALPGAVRVLVPREGGADAFLARGDEPAASTP